MHIAGEATLGVTARDRLRQQIDNLSRELATLDDLVAEETGGARAGMYRTSIQTGRASALQTQLTDKRAELESLIERERALGPQRAREPSPADVAIERAKPVERAKPGDRTGGGFRLRRGALLGALAPIAIIAIVILGLQARDLVLARLGPIG